MSIEAQTVEYVYVADGISVVFPFPSRFLASTDILVGLDGVEQNSGFSVGGAGSDSGGSVVFSTAPANGVRVALIRKPNASQLVDFINGQTVLEGILDNALDKLTMICQYLLRSNGRSIRLSDFDSTTSMTPLPAVADRANRFLAFDAAGLPVVVPQIGDIAAVPFATQAQAVAGTDNATIMTPLRVAQVGAPLADAAITARLASQAEAESGVDATKLMTPLRVSQAIAALGVSGSGQFYDVVVNGGVDNTGATNVTVSLEAAFAAAAAAKKVAWVPEGIYEIEGDSIDITVNNLMVAMHKNAVIRKSLNTASPAVKVVANGLRWSGGNITYTNTNTLVSGDHAGLWLEGTDLSVEKLKVKGRFYVGVYLLNCRDTVIRDAISKGAVNRAFYYAANNTGVGDANTTFDNCKADGAEAEGSSIKYTYYGFNTNAFGLGVAYNVRFISCFAQFCSFHGFGMSERISQCQVIGCRSDDISGPAFLVQEANGFRGSRITFSGCSTTRAQYGFMVVNSDYVSISGATATLCSADGFYFLGATNVSLSGSMSENTTGWGFISDATSSRISFVGCIATANGSGGYSIGGTGHATIGNI